MSQIHYQRLAWDSARTIVASIESGNWPWLAYQLGEQITPELRDHLVDSFTRLGGRPEFVANEVGIWRATLTDVLTSRPDAAAGLISLMAEARARMSMIAA